jgi:hypothetical protein
VGKLVGEFIKSLTDGCKQGVSGRCKECNRARNQAYKARNRKFIKDGDAKYRALQKEVLHYGIDEKFGATWGYLTMALWSMRNDCAI